MGDPAPVSRAADQGIEIRLVRRNRGLIPAGDRPVCPQFFQFFVCPQFSLEENSEITESLAIRLIFAYDVIKS